MSWPPSCGGSLLKKRKPSRPISARGRIIKPGWRLCAGLRRRTRSFQNPENAKKLFGPNLRVSASQVEKYYLCRFQYFCRYGLRAKGTKAGGVRRAGIRQPDALPAGEYAAKFSGQALASMGKQELLSQKSACFRRLCGSEAGRMGRKIRPVPLFVFPTGGYGPNAPFPFRKRACPKRICSG